MLRPSALQEEDGSLVARADQLLERRERNKEPRALAVLDDARNAPVVVEDAIGLASSDVLRFCGHVVHQEVVRPFYVLALEKHEAAGDFAKALLVDSIDEFNAGSIELKEHWGDILNVFQFFQLVSDLDGHRRSAEGQKHGRRGRLQHDVGADAFNALGRLCQQAGRQPHDYHHQRYFHRNRQHRDQRPQRAVEQIAEDEFAHHGFLSSASSPTRTSSAPAGCSSLKRSAGISSFSASFVTRKSKR